MPKGDRSPLRFRAIQWGPKVGEGFTDPSVLTMQAIGKFDREPNWCVVAAEYVCSRLAALTGLRVPPGGLTFTEEGEPAFFSIRFGHPFETHKKQPQRVPIRMNPKRFVSQYEHFAAGMAAFDAWVFNDDRHRANVEIAEGVPVAFDHSHALGACGDRDTWTDNSFDPLRPLGRHEHAAHLARLTHVLPWVDRIHAVLPHMIEPIFEECETIGILSQMEATLIYRMLIDRRDVLLELLKPVTPQVHTWPMELT